MGGGCVNYYLDTLDLLLNEAGVIRAAISLLFSREVSRELPSEGGVRVGGVREGGVSFSSPGGC